MDSPGTSSRKPIDPKVIDDSSEEQLQDCEEQEDDGFFGPYFPPVDWAVVIQLRWVTTANWSATQQRERLVCATYVPEISRKFNSKSRFGRHFKAVGRQRSRWNFTIVSQSDPSASMLISCSNASPSVEHVLFAASDSTAFLRDCNGIKFRRARWAEICIFPTPHIWEVTIFQFKLPSGAIISKPNSLLSQPVRTLRWGSGMSIQHLSANHHLKIRSRIAIRSI